MGRKEEARKTARRTKTDEDVREEEWVSCERKSQRKTGTGRGEKKIRKKFGKSYNREEREGGRERGREVGGKRARKRESSCSCSFEERPDFYSDSRLCHMI